MASPMGGYPELLARSRAASTPGASLFFPSPEIAQARQLRAGPEMPWLQQAALATSTIPVLGDVAGLASDVAGFASGLEPPTPLNLGLAALGTLPFVPSLNLLRAGRDSGSVGPGEQWGRVGDPEHAKRLGVGGSRAGTVPARPRYGDTVLRNRQRPPPYPGIYGDPADIIADVNVAPEDPALREVFGVTRSDLFDIARERTSSLPDWVPEATPARPGGSAAARNVITPSNRRRLLEIGEEAMGRTDLAEGMVPWYVMDPVYDRMTSLMGPARAAERYNQLHMGSSLLSPGSDVLLEYHRGSAADWLNQRGRFGEFLEYGGKPAGRFADPELAHLRGHAYHSTAQAPALGRFLSEGTLGKAAKVPAYAMAGRPPELGMQWHYPVGDAHWSRGVGLADVRPSQAYAQSATLPEMTTLAPWYRGIGQQLGIEAVPMQALQWGALSRQTGVQTPVGAGKAELLAQMLMSNAQRTGRSVQDLTDEFLMSGYPLDLPAGYVPPVLED